MFAVIKRFLIGRPLKNEAAGDQKYGVLWGLPVLASDAVSSVAYAGQEMLIYLLPAIGVMAYMQMAYISAAIIGLLALLMLSYRQTIACYPNGGGAYIVAKDNLGVIAGVTAGAALCIDYIMTVAVSIASGVEQLVSLLYKGTGHHPVILSIFLCVVIVMMMMLGNLRGIKESSKIFGIPAYAFILGMVTMLITGFIKLKGGYVPPEPTLTTVFQPITIMLILKAFSNGCTAVTGVEAISNAVPNFKEPHVEHARKVLLLLSIIVCTLFGGTALLLNYYHVDPVNGAVLVQVAEMIFGKSFMLYYVTATTFLILVMAANTAYSDFPMLIAVMARDGYVPRQLSRRGDRLSYSNGIIILSLVAALLLVVFKAKVTSLIGLYAVGVFISFTLSQTGMLVHWLKYKGEHWHLKATINTLGAVLTSIVVCVIAVVKFNEGAWVVVFLIPILVLFSLRVKRHYKAVSMQLRIKPENLEGSLEKTENYRNMVIVPIESVNKLSVRALRYAKTISDNVVAFNVSIDEQGAKKVKERYGMLKTNIPLIVKYSPFRKIVKPLLKFIESLEYEYKKGDIITVVLPEFLTVYWWHTLLHNHTRVLIERALFKHKHIVVATMPLRLKDDDIVLNDPKYK